MVCVEGQSDLAKNALRSNYVSRGLVAIAVSNILLVLMSSGIGAQDLTPISGGQVRRVLVADDVSLSDPPKQDSSEHGIPSPTKAEQHHSTTSKHIEPSSSKASNSTIAAPQGSQASLASSSEPMIRQTRATTRKHTTSSTTSGTSDTENTGPTTVKAPSKIPAEDLDDHELEKIVEERKKKKMKPETEDDTDYDDDEEDDTDEHSKRKKNKNRHRTTTTPMSSMVDTSAQATPDSMKQFTEANDTSARAILPTLKASRRRRPTGAPKSDANSTTSLSQINKSQSSPKPLNVSTEYLKSTTPWSSSQDLSKYLNSQRHMPNQSKSSNSSQFQYATVSTNPPINETSSTTPSLVSDTSSRFQYLPDRVNGTYQNSTSNGSTTPVSVVSVTSGRLQELINQSNRTSANHAANSSTTPYFFGENHPRSQSTVEAGNGTFTINIANGPTTPSSISTTSGRLQDIFEQGNRTIAELIKDIKELHVRVEEGPKEADSLRRFIIFCSIVARSNASLTLNQSVITPPPQEKQINVSSVDYLKATWFSNPDLSKYPSSKRNESNFAFSSQVNGTDQPLFASNTSLNSFPPDSTTTPSPVITSARLQDTADSANRTYTHSTTVSPNVPPVITKTVAHPQETVEPRNRTIAILIKDLKEEHTRIEEGAKEQADSLRHFIIICSIAVVVATSLAVALILLLMR